MNTNRFNYDYSKTLWMKMFLAKPDWEKGTSEVFINFEQALEIIRMMDNITQGIKKILSDIRLPNSADISKLSL